MELLGATGSTKLQLHFLAVQNDLINCQLL